MNQNQLKLLFAEVIRGFSKVKINGDYVFFRHPNLLFNSSLDSSYDGFLKEAQNKGLKSRPETEDELIQRGSWTKQKDKELEDLKTYKASLLKSKSLVIKKADKDEFDLLIAQTDEKIAPIIAEKESLIGFTAEIYANRRINEQLVYESFFRDEKFLAPFLDESDIDDCEDTDLASFLTVYGETSSKFSENNIKKLALSPFFLNLFMLCDDDPYKFYGKCVLDLSFYQLNVFSNAKHYKSLISNSTEEVPEKLFENPEAFVEWFRSRKNAEAIVGAGNDVSAIVGVSKEDLQALGVKTEIQPDFHKKALEKGGTLSMEDMLNMDGE